MGSLKINHSVAATMPNNPAKELSSNAWNADHTVTGSIDADTVGGEAPTAFEDAGAAATHSALASGVHGVGLGTVAKVSDIATDGNLSVAAQDAISKRHANTLDHTQNGDTDLNATFEATFEKNANKGVVSGYAGLDSNSKVATANLGGAGADSTKYLRGDQSWVIPPLTPDDMYYRRTGTTRERWFTVQTTCTAMTVSTALTANRIYAHPFVVPKTITIDRIAVNCTTLVSGGGLRLGIYNDNNGEPGTRLLDADVVSTAGTGVLTITISQQLTAGLYWLAAASSHATHAFRVPAIAATINMFGVASTLPTGVGTHFYAAHTYGALPDPFPTPTEGTSLVYPAIFVRLSA